MIVSWFSAGVSSAVATKLFISGIDKIIYTHIDDQHPDTMRFVKDCERWFGKEIEILQSPYKSVENACLGAAFVNGVHGAPCTRLLKRRVLKEWEETISDSLTYVWGFDRDERDRCEKLCETMRNQNHLFPLMDRNLSKKDAHNILKASGIKRPAMYDLGYNNNNCIGCVKGGMGYWNHIRVDFPDVFKKRAEMERVIGASCIKDTFLDELDPERGRTLKPIVESCGIFCELMAI